MKTQRTIVELTLEQFYNKVLNSKAIEYRLSSNINKYEVSYFDNIKLPKPGGTRTKPEYTKYYLPYEDLFTIDESETNDSIFKWIKRDILLQKLILALRTKKILKLKNKYEKTNRN